MIYLLALSHRGHAEPTRLYRVRADSIRAVEVLAHRVAAQHRHSYPHECQLDQYTVISSHGATSLPRIEATGGIFHGDWPDTVT